MTGHFKSIGGWGRVVPASVLISTSPRVKAGSWFGPRPPPPGPLHGVDYPTPGGPECHRRNSILESRPAIGRAPMPLIGSAETT